MSQFANLFSLGLLGGDSPSKDAFSRERVSLPQILFSETSTLDASPLAYATSTSGTGAVGAHDPDRASVQLTTAGVDGDLAIRQSRRYFPYEAGNSQFVAMTFVAEATDNVFMVRRTHVGGSPIDFQITQSQWSEDTFDGSGDENNPSGIQLDFTKAQILVIDLQWLGIGRVRTYFDVDGVLYPAHFFEHANVVSSVYMSSAALPVRWEVRDGASSDVRRIGYFDDDNGIFLELQNTTLGGGTLETICASVAREGGAVQPSRSNFAPVTALAGMTTTLQSVIAVRLRTGYERAFLEQFEASLTNEGSVPLVWQLMLIRNADIPAGMTTWNTVGGAFAPAAEYSLDVEDVSGITDFRAIGGGVITGGGSAASPGAQAQGWVASQLGVAADVAGNSDVMILAAKTLSGTADIAAALNWAEIY